MATSFDKIEDLALVTVNDYKLGKIYNQNQTAFQTYVDGFLISAIPNFTGCRQSLEYDATTREFTADLTNLEISILADFWVLAWWEREKNNAAQLQNRLQTSNSFRSHSEAENLKEKRQNVESLRERVSQKQTDYQLLYVDDLFTDV